MKVLRFAPALLLAVFGGLGLVASNAVAAQAPPGAHDGTASSGEQARSPVEPGKVDAKPGRALGPTKLVTIDEKTHRPTSGQRADPAVGFNDPLNYCAYQLVYTPVYNTSAVAKNIEVAVVNQGQTRTYFGTVAANSTAFVPFYGVSGTYYAYLYVWDGLVYSYDDSRSGNNTCTVTATAACSTVYAGWVQVNLTNSGTAYASVQTQKLQPVPQEAYYDYPTPGGATVIRYVYAGTSPYAIAVDVLSSSTSPYYFSGTC